MQKFSIIGSIILVLALIGLGYFLTRDMKSEGPEQPGGSVSNEVDAAIRARVTEFGTKLKNVSLLQPQAQLRTQMQSEYGLYLTADLLAQWQENPEEALGRTTSSPWPDRIQVASVTKQEDDTYKVEGNVIEISSADRPSEPAAIYPVTMRLEKVGNTWLIDEAEKGAYSEIPQRVSVVGKWDCLKHKNSSGPQTGECALGIALDGGGYLAVNTSLMSTYPVDFPTGTRVRIEGIMTPADQLSTNMWQKYDMEGIISATSIQKVE